MADIIEKESNSTIKVTTTETKTTSASYDYDFLLSQKIAIEADIVRNQNELQKVIDLIAEADALGVKSKE